MVAVVGDVVIQTIVKSSQQSRKSMHSASQAHGASESVTKHRFAQLPVVVAVVMGLVVVRAIVVVVVVVVRLVVGGSKH